MLQQFLNFDHNFVNLVPLYLDFENHETRHHTGVEVSVSESTILNCYKKHFMNNKILTLSAIDISKHSN